MPQGTLYIHKIEKSQGPEGALLTSSLSKEAVLMKALHRFLEDQGIPQGEEVVIRRPAVDMGSGKPYVDNYPLTFSLSHSGNLWVCLVALDAWGPVGLDLEKLRPMSFDPRPLAQRYFLPEEQQWLAEGEPVSRFTELWTRKEALAKLYGVSIFRMLEKGPLLQTGEEHPFYDEGKERVFFTSLPLGQAIPEGEAYRCTLATLTPFQMQMEIL